MRQHGRTIGLILTALWRWFAHRWVNHLLVLACLSLALTQLAASFALHTGTDRYYRRMKAAFASGNAQILVRPKSKGDRLRPADVEKLGREFPDARIVSVRSIVTGADTASGQPVAILCTHPVEAFRMNLIRLVRGRRPDEIPKDVRPLWLEQGFAARRGYHLNDRIRLTMPGGARSFTIVGLIANGGLVLPGEPSHGVSSFDAVPGDDTLGKVYIELPTDTQAFRVFPRLREMLVSQRVERPSQNPALDISVEDALSQTMICMLTAASVVVCVFLIRSLVVDDLSDDRYAVMTLHGLGCGSVAIKGLFALRMFGFLGIASAIALGVGPRVAGWTLVYLHRGPAWMTAGSECGLTPEQLGLCLSTLVATVLIGMNPYLLPIVSAPTRLGLPKPVEVVAQGLGACLLFFVLYRLTRTSTAFHGRDMVATFFVGPFLLAVVYTIGAWVPRVLARLWSGRHGMRGNVLQSTFLKAIDASTIRSQTFLSSCVVGAMISLLLIILSVRFFANQIRGDLFMCMIETRHAPSLERLFSEDDICRHVGTGRITFVDLPSHRMRVEAGGVPDVLGEMLLSLSPQREGSWRSSTTAAGGKVYPTCQLSTNLAFQLGMGPGDSITLAGDRKETTFMVVGVLPLPMEKGLLIPLAELERLTDADRSIVVGRFTTSDASTYAEARSRITRKASQQGFGFGAWITGATKEETDRMVDDITRFFPPMIAMFVTLGGLTVTLVGIQNVRKSRRLYVCLHNWGMTSGQFLAATWPALVSLILALSVVAWVPPFAAYWLVCDKISRRIILSGLPPVPLPVILETFGASVLIAGVSIALPRLVLTLRPGFGRDPSARSE